MHRIILSLILIFPLLTVAQAPEKINFQSIIRNKEGVIWSNKLVSLKIGILEGDANGTISYLESHTKTTDFSGLISLQIGTGNICLLYTSPSPRDRQKSRMPSSA